MSIDIVLAAVVVAALVNLLFLSFLRREMRRSDQGNVALKLIQLESALTRVDPLIRTEFSSNREEHARALRETREEQGMSLRAFEQELKEDLRAFKEDQHGKHEDLVNRQEAIRRQTEEKLGEVRATVESKLVSLQDDNNRKLEEMRKTVDEKLQEGLETRFNATFKRIAESLETVHRGLGEMQTLATGVGDLKKIFTNVKSRGIVGEIQLQKLLDDFLAAGQYAVNVAIDPLSNERVEFAVRFPGPDDTTPVYLPIDSKFPLDEYHKLLAAYEAASTIGPKAVESARKAFASAVIECAKKISSKYIKPPHSTDYAILFVPTEGLYAEIVQDSDVFGRIQSEFHVTVAGPSNLAAILTSLQLGFRTHAIERRSGEVWQVLAAVKSEFTKFGDVIDQTQKKIEAAAQQFETVGRRTRVMKRALRKVEEIPYEESRNLLGPSIAADDEELSSDIDE